MRHLDMIQRGLLPMAIDFHNAPVGSDQWKTWFMTLPVGKDLITSAVAKGQSEAAAKSLVDKATMMSSAQGDDLRASALAARSRKSGTALKTKLRGFSSLSRALSKSGSVTWAGTRNAYWVAVTASSVWRVIRSPTNAPPSDIKGIMTGTPRSFHFRRLIFVHDLLFVGLGKWKSYAQVTFWNWTSQRSSRMPMSCPVPASWQLAMYQFGSTRPKPMIITSCTLQSMRLSDNFLTDLIATPTSPTKVMPIADDTKCFTTNAVGRAGR